MLYYQKKINQSMLCHKHVWFLYVKEVHDWCQLVSFLLCKLVNHNYKSQSFDKNWCFNEIFKKFDEIRLYEINRLFFHIEYTQYKISNMKKYISDKIIWLTKQKYYVQNNDGKKKKFY